MYASRRRSRSARAAAPLLAVALIAAGCSNRGDDASPGTTAPAAETTASAPVSTATDAPDTTSASSDTTVASDTTAAPPTTAEPQGAMFGDLASPCGPGATIAEGQNGGDTLVLATATDRGAAMAPGLTQEMYDAAVAFAGWCNEQGGIAGLPIEVLDADGALFQVPVMMETVCDSAFAMVGGGWAFDDQVFPRFHECGMIDIAGYTVTAAKAMSDGMAQPIPNPSNARNVGWFVWAKEQHPEAMQGFATVYPDIPTTKAIADSYVEELGILGGVDVVDRVPYSAVGEANWAPFPLRLREAGASAIAVVGSPEQFMPFMRAAREIGYEPELILQEANNYAPMLLTSADTEGVIVRSNITPFEEADRSPAMAAYLQIMEDHRPDGKIGALGVQAMSAYLLFAVGANACLAENGGVLERSCVLSSVKEVRGWTGGGLHVPSNPGENRPTECTLLLQVVDGAFTRLYPELGGADDSGNGFACDPAWVVDLTGDYGDETAGRFPGGS